MGLSRKQLIAAIWLACCAMLMAALAPSVSHLLAASGPPVAPICGEAASGHAHRDGGALASLLVDCGYCTMQADLPALPPLPAWRAALVDLVRIVVPVVAHHPAPAFRWRGIQPRAPPY